MNFQDKYSTPVPAGDILRDMLEAKGWTQETLATITKISRQTISSIIAGRSGITLESAMAFSAAFGNDPIDWMKADLNYRISTAKKDDEIYQRSLLYEMAPINDMCRRGWIKSCATTNELHEELTKFYGYDIQKNGVTFPIATRRTEKLEFLTPAEKAWSFRAKKIAEKLIVSEFSQKKLVECEKKIRTLAAYSKEIRHLPKILSSYGIRFVIVEPIPNVKIDGAAFWLEKEPVIAMSVRYDRIDNFWFTFMHEFAHIKRGDAYSFDKDLVDNTNGIIVTVMENEAERMANEMASDALIPAVELESFIRRVGPLYSKERIIQFAHKVKIHPGIVVGQLQHKKEIGYSASRSFLVKVRDIVISTTLTDGWNKILPDLA